MLSLSDYTNVILYKQHLNVLASQSEAHLNYFVCCSASFSKIFMCFMNMKSGSLKELQQSDKCSGVNDILYFPVKCNGVKV